MIIKINTTRVPIRYYSLYKLTYYFLLIKYFYFDYYKHQRYIKNLQQVPQTTRLSKKFDEKCKVKKLIISMVFLHNAIFFFFLHF